MLEARGLGHGYGDRTLYRDLNLIIRPGECWALLGLNGAGKSTLLHTLAGLIQPDQGEVALEGESLGRMQRRGIARRLGILLQQQSAEFPVTVLETVMTGRHSHRGIWGWTTPDEMRQAQALLQQLDLEALQHHLTDTLSGGERRRLAIAQLLFQQPAVALLDEPDSQLDPCRKMALTQLLADRFRQPERGCIMSLHDINLAQRHCSHVLMLYGDGAWRAGPIHRMLTRQNLEQLYGCQVTELQGPEGRFFLPGYA